MYCTFKNDNNVSIELTTHKNSTTFMNRDNHEVQFRRINTYLIKNNIIKNNIIDLGAWIGDNTIPWAKNINGTVYAIDPSFENCEFIIDLCKLNNINNVKVIQSAISDKNEILTTTEDINHCSFVYKYNEDITHKVSAVSLDYLHQIKVLENIGYIHLDVEGMEKHIIRGSQDIINKYRPIISFEQHLELDNYNEISDSLKSKDYKVFLIDEILPGCRLDCRNSFAFPNETIDENAINTINILTGNILIQK